MNPANRALEEMERLRHLPPDPWANAKTISPLHLEALAKVNDRSRSPEILDASELLWITADIVALVRHASANVPKYEFDPDLLLWPHAICFSETPLGIVEVEGENIPISIDGIQWFKGTKDHTVVYALHRGQEGWLRVSMFTCKRGLPLDDGAARHITHYLDVERPTTEAEIAERRREFLGRFATLALLLRQRIALRERASGDRATRRRWERERGTSPKDITIVTLRKPINAPDREADGTRTIDWSHRWMVGCHWRRQFYPSNGTHETILISAYEKGPKDKPLILKKRVNLWVQ